MEISSYSLASQLYGVSTVSNTTVEEEIEEVVDSSAVETVEPTEEELFEAFKTELRNALDEIYKNAPSNLLSSSVDITDEALQKMYEDEDFYNEMLTDIKDDASGLSAVDYSVYMNVTIDTDGYSRKETAVYDTDSPATKIAKAELAKAEAGDAFYHEEINDLDRVRYVDILLNKLSSGTSSADQDEQQKYLLSLLSEQQNFIQQHQEHQALKNNSTTTTNTTSMFDSMISSTNFTV